MQVDGGTAGGTAGTPRLDPPGRYRLAVGMLAYNESASITTTIRSLFAQSYFRELPPDVEAVVVTCVPNGCTDDTAAVAGAAFDEARDAGLDPRVRCEVVVLEKGSKTGSWNRYVHEIADRGADLVLMMDGDVRVGEPHTVRNLVRVLREAPHAVLSTPRTVKHVEITGPRNPFEFLAIHLGKLTQSRGWGFAGCMYLARGPFVRRIWFPPGMVGDDAFLNGMVVTDLCLLKTERNDRVVRAPDATVVFEAYTAPTKMYRALRRQAVIRGMDAVLWGFLWAHTGELDAGEVIRRRSEADPDWYRRLIADHVRSAGWWVMPAGVVTRRWKYLRNLRGWRRVAYTPLAAFAVAVDLVVHADANRMIRGGRVDGLWETTRTTKI